MRDDEIDRALGGEDDVVPTSGFHASVMEAVHREASAPPPIPFPWTRAWPAFAASAVVFVGASVLLGQAGATSAPDLDSLRRAAQSLGAPWIAVATLATAFSLLLSRRLAGERS
jgi:hypothetical protein